MINIKNRIQKARKHAGFSQAQFAEELEIGYRSVQRYENDDISNISYQTVLKISELCNVNPNWLFLGQGKMADSPPEENSLDRQNSELVEHFKNKEILNKILNKLLKIEKDKIALSKIEAYIEGLSS